MSVGKPWVNDSQSHKADWLRLSTFAFPNLQTSGVPLAVRDSIYVYFGQDPPKYGSHKQPNVEQYVVQYPKPVETTSLPQDQVLRAWAKNAREKPTEPPWTNIPYTYQPSYGLIVPAHHFPLSQESKYSRCTWSKPCWESIQKIKENTISQPCQQFFDQPLEAYGTAPLSSKAKEYKHGINNPTSQSLSILVSLPPWAFLSRR